MIFRYNDKPESEALARVRRRYEGWRIVLLALLTVTFLTAVVLLFIQNQNVLENQVQIQRLLTAQDEEAKHIANLLRSQKEADSRQQARLDKAITAIQQEQYRALVAHDRRTETAIRTNLALLQEELYGSRNIERPTEPAAAPIPTPGTASAPVGPPTGLQPTPTPAPAPSPAAPCRQRGNSGRCK